MTTKDAYKLTIEKAKELKRNGIDFTIRSSNLIKDKETIKKYSGPERILPQKWIHLTFKITNKWQALKIHEAANYLGMCGITFDTGGCNTCRDWELDWSFKYIGKEDKNWRDRREEVEDIINNINN